MTSYIRTGGKGLKISQIYPPRYGQVMASLHKTFLVGDLAGFDKSHGEKTCNPFPRIYMITN